LQKPTCEGISRKEWVEQAGCELEKKKTEWWKDKCTRGMKKAERERTIWAMEAD
jgi:hypothetical protein